MNKYKLLSLDETGKASYNHPSALFILSGIVISESYKSKLDKLMRKLKKKYFSKEELVFHSRDMSRKKGPFKILQDQDKEKNFWTEFVSIVNNRNINAYFIIVNKKNARKSGWQPKTILKKSYLKILEEFIIKLGKTEHGKIITESDPSQDFYLIQAHNRIQSLGTTNKSITADNYRKRITSLSLVNKANLDIDIQIADALAPIAGMIYCMTILKKKNSISQIDQMKKNIIDQKLKTGKSLFKILI